jgi:predicted phage-related endonuclease
VFAVLIGDDLRIYKVDKDVETIQGIRQREVDFWNAHVLAKLPPPALTASDVLTLFTRDIGTTVEASPDLAQIAVITRHMKDELKILEQNIATHELQIKLAMESAANLTYQGKILATFKTQTANRLDQKLLAEDLPEVVEQYKRLNEYRVLRIK